MDELATSVILDTLLATNGVQKHGGFDSQESTIVESVQKYIEYSGICIFGTIAATNSDNMRAPHNSNRGIVWDFMGATLVLAEIKCVVVDSAL